MLTDCCQALRGLVRDRNLTAVACLTLMLGFSITVTTFSVLDAALLRPLPYYESERLANIILRRGTGQETRVIRMSSERLNDLRAQTHLFEAIEAQA